MESGFTGPEMSPESGGGDFGSFAGSKKDKQQNWWFGVDKCRSSILCHECHIAARSVSWCLL